MPLTRLEDFKTWIASRDPGPFYIGNHRFEKKPAGTVLVDKGEFELEEAEEVGTMLLSTNPMNRLTAETAIWEKNGTLIKVVLVGVIILLGLVIFIISR